MWLIGCILASIIHILSFCIWTFSLEFAWFSLRQALKETIKVMLTCTRSLVRRLRSLQICSWVCIGHNVWPCNLLSSILQKSLTGQPLFIQYIMWFEIYQSNFKNDIRLIIFHYIVIQRGFVILVLVDFLCCCFVFSSIKWYYHQVCNKSNRTGVTSGPGTACPSFTCFHLLIWEIWSSSDFLLANVRYCLSFDLRLLLTHLVSSNFS